MKTVAIVPAAGSGKRLGSKVQKPFILLGGKPLISHCLLALDASPLINAIVVAVGRESLGRVSRIIKRSCFRKEVRIVRGGATRLESVLNCLKAAGNGYDIVLIHDAARPFLTEGLIKRSIEAAARHGACVAALPERDTVKLSGGGTFVRKTVDRSRLWRAQTPQAFRRPVITSAYAIASLGRARFTDDSSLVEALGRRVKLIRGSSGNIKITTAEDLEMARAIIKLKIKDQKLKIKKKKTEK